MFKSLAVVAVLLVAGLPSLDAGMLYGPEHHYNALSHYGYFKIMSSVLGKDNAKQYHKFLLENMSGCFFDYFANYRKDYQDGKHGMRKAGVPDPKPFYGAFTVECYKNETLKYITLTSCLFEKLHMSILEDGTVDGTYFKEFFATLPVDDLYKTIVEKRLSACEAKSAQGNFLRLGEQFADHQKVTAFFRCAAEAAMDSAIEFDFHHNQDEYDLAGLGNTVAEFEDPQKRWYVFSSFMNFATAGLWDNIL